MDLGFEWMRARYELREGGDIEAVSKPKMIRPKQEVLAEAVRILVEIKFEEVLPESAVLRIVNLLGMLSSKSRLGDRENVRDWLALQSRLRDIYGARDWTKRDFGFPTDMGSS